MNDIPKHIAVIPDGNRRYAKKYNLPIYEAYKIGSEKTLEFLNWCMEFGIKVVTFFVISYDNFLKRSKEDVDAVLRLLREKLKKIREYKNIIEDKVKIKIIGRTHLLPDDIQKEIKLVEDLTKNNSRYYLNLAVVYGSRQEIIDGIKRLFEDFKKGIIDINNLDESLFMRYLYFGDEIPYPEPDLIIRTSGEHRISNYLLYQSAYSELYFIEKYWPEITKEDFINAIEWYKKRERRFGK
ncbi:MAG: polyprenyl diphosphate synthase [Candidatus Nanopusillus sp.]|jgi:tritrans,polycis-undecaprenyl-diphosphate synthase [geranylgeranyl-diphosphate specific]|nr:polyprenyl diphosphate synthase [Candidatus Nanopusillus sp.]